MEKTFIISFVILICAFSEVSSLQCYMCRNCTQVKNEHLQTCENIIQITTPTPNITTPIYNITNPIYPTTPIYNNTTLIYNNTTPIYNNTTPIYNNTTPAYNNSTPIENATNPLSHAVYNAPPVKLETENNGRCLCKDINNCNCNEPSSRVESVQSTSTVSYVCVREQITESGRTIVNRGCAILQNTTQATCLGANFTSNCTTCNVNRCNSAVSYKSSLIVLITTYLLLLVQFY